MHLSWIEGGEVLRPNRKGKLEMYLEEVWSACGVY